MKAAWFTLESLTAHLGRATVDDTVSTAVAKNTRCDLRMMRTGLIRSLVRAWGVRGQERRDGDTAR